MRGRRSYLFLILVAAIALSCVFAGAFRWFQAPNRASSSSISSLVGSSSPLRGEFCVLTPNPSLLGYAAWIRVDAGTTFGRLAGEVTQAFPDDCGRQTDVEGLWARAVRGQGPQWARGPAECHRSGSSVLLLSRPPRDDAPIVIRVMGGSTQEDWPFGPEAERRASLGELACYQFTR